MNSHRSCSSPISTSTRSRARSTACRSGRRAARRPYASALATSSTAPTGRSAPPCATSCRHGSGAGRRGRVHLLAQLRTFGWLFNPLAVYYCWTPDGRALDAIVLEVTNTPWGQRHWYVLDARRNMTTTTTAKAMHVSPFLPMDVDYRITWTVPDAELNLRIEVERDHTPVFDAELALRRTTINRGRAVTVLARYPMLPLRVSAGIYAKAARLFARGVPVYRHPSRRRERSSR